MKRLIYCNLNFKCFREFTSNYSSRKQNRIIYTIGDRIAPFQLEHLRIHYQHNIPVSVLNYAWTNIEVSHWANIAVESSFQIENVGALLEGEFGRVDYDDYGRIGGKNAIKELRASLPLKSSNLWYGDEIGNVSSSHAAREWDDVRLDLEPRFPILGGWKSNFNIGYILPSKFQINTTYGNRYSVNLTFATPFKDIMARNYTMSVILPEGSSDIKVNFSLIYLILA